ncbi:DUF3077 domain-containing protein [Pseudomonas weihenstephanensis]
MRWASHYLSEMAKTTIDDVTLGLQQVENGIHDSSLTL